MKINLVLRDRNWVMENLVNHFYKYLPTSKISNSACFESDANFYFNWHSLEQKTKFDICWFTHIENRPMWDAFINRCDVAVLHGNKYKDAAPFSKRIICNPPPFENYLSAEPVKILVVGRNYSSGRKNFELAKEIGAIDGIELNFTEGKLTTAELLEAYHKTDYVLVTSEIEAGPMCVVESLAMRKPVIAPDTGWCWDFPVIKYNTPDELKEICRKLIYPVNAWENTVASIYQKILKIYNARFL